MKKYKNLIFYTSIVSLSAALLYIIITLGKENLEAGRNILDVVTSKSAWENFKEAVFEEATGSITLLIFQIIVILFFVRFFGWICQRIGQPTVIGEIIAGIVLGPSLLGAYFPEISNIIFPASSIGNIKLLSEIGLILFMFIVGMELDLKILKKRANDAVLISHSCIAGLFVLGGAFAYFIYPSFTYPSVHFLPFALFMGIAMSITAFPVLARIVHERGLNKTPLGAMVITCAAVDDITAWCLLAAVIAIAKAGTFVSSIYVILFAIIYVVVMFKLVKPFLQRIADTQTSKNNISKSVVSIFFLVLLLSSYLSSIIGIHPLFGAFLAGVVMPPNMNFRKIFVDKIEDISLILLLPLFFVYTGLNTKIGLLNTPELWAMAVCVICIATFGKLFIGTFVSRYVGFDWKSSMTIGALMNTRGLMELVVLNIGYDLGILTPEVFAMMVVMALFTTFLTSPLLNLIDRIFKNKPASDVIPAQKTFKILIAFENSVSGKKLLLIANSFIKRDQQHSEVDMLHVSSGNDLYQHDMEDEEDDLFTPIVYASKALNQTINPIFEVASNPEKRIVKIANDGNYDFLLMSPQRTIYGGQGNILGHFLGITNKILHIPVNLYSIVTKTKKAITGNSFSIDERTRNILINTNAPVGIFIDNGLVEVKNVIVLVLSEDDTFVSNFMKRMARHCYSRITLWDDVKLMDKSIEFVKCIREIKNVNPYLFQLWNNNIPLDKDIFMKNDLVMISLKSWIILKDKHPNWIKAMPSVLLLNE